LQIFFDFSGYTDMAIGMSKLFGFHFPVNFRRPYLAGSLTEFWRRWHISLSSWLRDYLYIPLGGNRRGLMRTYANLLMTMLLGWLWHGASWNFERGLGIEKARWWRVPLTFVLVMHGWVFFRAATFEDARLVLEHLWRGPQGSLLLNPWQWGLAAGALIVALFEERYDLEELLVKSSSVAYGSAIAAMLLVLEVFAVTDVEIPFVYFQF